MNDKLLTEHHLEFLSLKSGCTGSYESILVKMSHNYWVIFQTSLPYFSVTMLLEHIGIVSMCTNNIQSMFFND